MARKTLVGTPDGRFEALLIDVSLDLMERRHSATPEMQQILTQAVYLATYYAHHEVSPHDPSLHSDIAYIPMLRRGLRRAAEQGDLPLPAVCRSEPPFNEAQRALLLRTSRHIRISTAQVLVGKAPEGTTCDDTRGHEYFATSFASSEVDPERKKEIVRLIKDCDFTIPIMGGLVAEN